MTHGMQVIDGECLVVLEGHRSSIYCIAPLPVQLHCPEEGYYGAVAPSHARIISGSGDKTLQIWDAAGQSEQMLKGHKGAVTCIATTERFIVSGSRDNTVRLWGLPPVATATDVQLICWVCQLVLPLPTNASVVCVLTLPHGAITCGDAKGFLHFWQMDGEICRDPIRAHQDRVNCMALVENQTLVTGSVAPLASSSTMTSARQAGMSSMLRQWA